MRAGASPWIIALSTCTRIILKDGSNWRALALAGLCSCSDSKNWLSLPFLPKGERLEIGLYIEVLLCLISVEYSTSMIFTFLGPLWILFFLWQFSEHPRDNLPRFIRSAEDRRSFYLAELAGFDHDRGHEIYSFFVCTESWASSTKPPDSAAVRTRHTCCWNR